MKRDVISYIGSGCSIIFSSLQTEEVRSIISWILTIIATTITILYTIYRWYKKAKEDGKIDKEEIEEGMEILNQGAQSLTDAIKKEENKKDE